MENGEKKLKVLISHVFFCCSYFLQFCLFGARKIGDITFDFLQFPSLDLDWLTMLKKLVALQMVYLLLFFVRIENSFVESFFKFVSCR